MTPIPHCMARLSLSACANLTADRWPHAVTLPSLILALLARFESRRRGLASMFGIVLMAANACGSPVFAADPDAETALLVRFENTATGAGGEVPATNTGIAYAAGVRGFSAILGSSSRLSFPRVGNLDPREGTLEFWIKPSWDGNDGRSHTVLVMGGGGGLLFGKDGANNWRCIFNRFSANGQPERGVAANIGSWKAGEWHHAAFTWGGGELRLYLDGELKASTTVPGLPQIPESTTAFELGGEGPSNPLEATLDELRISSKPRSELEIQRNYFSDLPDVTALVATPSEWAGWPTWSTMPVLTATTGLGQKNVPASLCNWTTTNAAVSNTDPDGRIRAVGPGTASVAATVGNHSATVAVTVQAAALPPEELAIDAGLATPAAGAVHEMPVAIVTYLPTFDGVKVNALEGATSASLAAMRSSILTMNRRVKFMLEEGSRFRGYQNAAARPSLGYRVVKNLVIYEPMPPGKPAGGGASFPDYHQIVERCGGRQLVEQQGVKEFWVWGYHTGKIVPVESNMSSPTTGDISNSYRFNDDLPVYDRTYVLYNYNYNRSQAEAVHNHGHQLESILSYVNQLRDGNTTLFWDEFCGRNPNGSFRQGRCGNTHFPPNGATDYDYTNTTPVPSDCEDWNPAGTGLKKSVNALTWGNLGYAWPDGQNVPQKTESQYYLYWMQNMPGLANGIRKGDRVMSNWWEFTADWDRAIREGMGLHAAPELMLDSRPTATGVSETAATLGGRVISDGGSPVTERGVVYAVDSVNTDPRIGGTGVTKLTVAGTTGDFTTEVTGLAQNTLYGYRAYAINGQGMRYSEVATFKTRRPSATISTPVAFVGGIGAMAGLLIEPGDTHRFTFSLPLSDGHFTTTGLNSVSWELRGGDNAVFGSGTGNVVLRRVLPANDYVLTIVNTGGSAQSFSLNLDASAPLAVRPDIAVNLKGRNVYSPAPQRLRIESKRAVARSLAAEIGNDGSLPGRLILRASSGNRHFAVNYFAGGSNRSAQLIAGTLVTPVIGSDDPPLGVALTVTPNRRLLTRSTRRGGRNVVTYLRKTYAGLIRATAETDPTRFDAFNYEVTTIP